jgi:hypothetical protein
MQTQQMQMVASVDERPSHGSADVGERQNGRASARARFGPCHAGSSGLRAVAIGLVALASAGAQAPTVELTLRDGRVVVATELRGDAKAGFAAVVAERSLAIAGADLLLVRGVATAVPALPSVWLQGGDVLRGAVTGGDDGGNRVELQSPAFGTLPVAVDRIEALAAPTVAEPLRLLLPDGVDEALFVRAKIGFDLLAGALHQFGAPGIRFQPDGADAPRWFGLADVAALRLRGAEPRADQPDATVWTRVGDRVGATLLRFGADGAQLALEGGREATLRWVDLGALALRSGCAHLSDLTPVAVREAGFDGDVVHPHRRDHNAVGGPLVVGGRAVGKGLGVHSKSRLAFDAPAGAARFWTRVGFDDGVALLGLSPHVEVRVLVAGKVVFERKDFAYGQPPQDTGLLPVQPGDRVELEVDFGKGRDLGDRVDWIAPMFLLGRP